MPKRMVVQNSESENIYLISDSDKRNENNSASKDNEIENIDFAG